MSVKNVVAIGDDQEWKRAVEEELRELRQLVDFLTRTENQ